MQNIQQHFINGQWQDITGDQWHQHFNPATGAESHKVKLGHAEDVDAAVEAASKALETWRHTTKRERQAVLMNLFAEYKLAMPQLASLVQQELGAPKSLCEQAQVPLGMLQAAKWSECLAATKFVEKRGAHQVRKEPVGVCGIITSWNWPMNGALGVLLPALMAGCTVVWKPSENASASASLLVDIFHKSGLPAGLINLVLGTGAEVGQRLVNHPNVPMISFTGSVATGKAIAIQTTQQVKRLVLELGGKSPWVVLPSANLNTAIEQCIANIMRNTGQTCNAASRLLVPADQLDQAMAHIKHIMAQLKVGDPGQDDTVVGPLGNAMQQKSVNEFIAKAQVEGCSIVAQANLPDNVSTLGFYVAPTVLYTEDTNSFAAQEEAFGPVLTLITYANEAQALAIANNSVFGLAAYVSASSQAIAETFANGIRCGVVHVNGADMDIGMPFGGVKQSGNGRKFGPEGLSEYLEVKSVLRPGKFNQRRTLARFILRFVGHKLFGKKA